MNNTNKQDLIKVIGVAVLVIVVLIALYVKKNTVSVNDLLNVCMEDECFLLEEELFVNVWNELEVEIDGKEYDEYPTIYGDITIGSDVQDVFKVFNIKPGYAYIDTEIDNALHDGTTDVEQFEFEDFDFLDREYLDACIIFGYKNVDGKYVMVKASELEDYLEDEDNTDIDILFAIDINGMSGEVVGIDEVIFIDIRVLD